MDGLEPQPIASPRAAAALLRHSSALWLAVAGCGQLFFAAYIAAFYGRSAARGDYAAWNGVLAQGIVTGDGRGNMIVGVHLFLAFVITLLGLAQLMPVIRSRAPAIHRWVGRAYIGTALSVSIAGLYLTWSRAALPGWALPNAIAISVNALLIMACATQALRHALSRRIALHRQWALRLFIVASGVWFLRVSVMLWILIAGPVGLGTNLHGPVGVALSFAQYLVPLAVLELYLRAQRSSSSAARLGMAGLLLGLTVAMGAGIVMAVLFMWLPHF